MASDLASHPISGKWPASHPDRLQLYSLPTPNGIKVSLMLEETGLPYEPHAVRFDSNDQLTPEFIALNPNNKIPAIIDPDGPGGKPLALFESGAILIYLAEKTGRFLSTEPRARKTVIEWVMWQMGGLGPMLGQNGHFLLYAPEKIPYAMDRYRREAERLYGVLDGQLGRTGAFVAGDEFTIADMACFPWTVTHKAQGFTLDDYPNIKRWFAEVRARPGVVRGMAVGKMAAPREMDAETRKNLFGITTP